MSDERAPEPAPPRLWVESFFESEREVRSVLDETLEAHVLGRHDTVRERLRAFSEAEYGVFRVVALSVLDIESFFADVEAQYDESETAPTAALRALSDEYSRLADEFELLFAEQTHELWNPMPALKRGFRYSEDIELPRLSYELYSGDVQLCEFVHPPSQTLMLARGLLAGTRELLNRVEENGDTVAAGERERLAFVYENLVTEVDQLAAHVDVGTDGESDENRGSGDGDDAEGGDNGGLATGIDSLNEVDAYHDWSVY